MRGVNPEERKLISLKLVHYKNGLMRQQRERDEKHTQWKDEQSDNGQVAQKWTGKPEEEMKEPRPDFPYKQKPHINPARHRKNMCLPLPQ